MKIRDLTKEEETHALAGGYTMLFLITVYAAPTAIYATIVQKVFTGWTMLVLTLFVVAVMPILHFSINHVLNWLYPLCYKMAFEYVNKVKI